MFNAHKDLAIVSIVCIIALSSFTGFFASEKTLDPRPAAPSLCNKMAHVVLVHDVATKVSEIMLLAIENDTPIDDVVGEASKLVMSVMQMIACTGSCKGITKKGSECKKKTGKGNMYCGVHADQRIRLPKRRDENSRVLCASITKKGELCKKEAYTLEGFCHTHMYSEAQEEGPARVVISCNGTTKSGNQCRKKAQAGKTSCFFHSNLMVQKCIGDTKKGTCNNIIHGNNTQGKYCMFHVKQYYEIREKNGDIIVRTPSAAFAQSTFSPNGDKRKDGSVQVPMQGTAPEIAPEMKERMCADLLQQKNMYKRQGPIGPITLTKLAAQMIASVSQSTSAHVVDESRKVKSSMKGFTRIASEPGSEEVSNCPEDYGEKVFPVSEDMFQEFSMRLYRNKIEMPKAALPIFMQRKIDENNEKIEKAKKERDNGNNTVGSGSSSAASSSAASSAALSSASLQKSGDLSIEELCSATFVHKEDRKSGVFDKEVLENMHPREILIGAFLGGYKRVKLDEMEENLDAEDIESVFEVYVGGVKRRDETLEVYKKKVRLFTYPRI